MNFEDLRVALDVHVKELMSAYGTLYEVELDKDELWNIYLDAIPPEHNKIYKSRREYDCSTCRHFVKNIGNVVAIRRWGTFSVETMWDIVTEDERWNRVCQYMSDYVKSHAICGVFKTDLRKVGADKTPSCDENGDVIVWRHMSATIPDKHRVRNASVASVKGDYASEHDVFKRSLDEITMDACNTVKELIAQDTIYRGAEYKFAVDGFARCKETYDKLTDDEKELYSWWFLSQTGHNTISRIKNTAIGTLLVTISDGEDLNVAVSKYEAMVAPENYKRSKPIYTTRMLDEAKKTITEMGYLDSLSRRFANADDITVNNILFRNADTAKRMDGDIFSAMAKRTKSAPKKFDKIAEIGIEKFISDVLPTATDVEVYLEARHFNNFCSLIAPSVSGSKTMFKWNNNFSWAYRGNLADSSLKQNVKNAGGKVDGVLRFSIQWNDLDDWDRNDMDAHCITPTGEIFYMHKRECGGELDVDIIDPRKGKPAVENITWGRMPVDGTYEFFVEKFSDRGGQSGIRAEVEFDGHVYQYDCRNINDSYDIAVVTIKNGKFIDIKHNTPTTESEREEWGVKSNTFVPVNVICFSPNYWDEQRGIGNKHYMFMLKGCVNPETPSAWYNEYLNSDLYPSHRKVMEAMGVMAHVEPVEDQLSGIGFSSTVRNDVVVKVKGATERVMRVRF